MDINDIWQEHKRFILILVGGVLVFLIAEAVIGHNYYSRIRYIASDIERIANDKKDGLAAVLPSSNNLKEAQARLAEYRDILQSLKTKMEFTPDPRFVLSDNESSPDLKYLDIGNKVRAEVLSEAERRDIDVDTHLGLPAVSPTKRQEIQRNLLAVDVARRVVLLAIEKGVKSVGPIKVKDTRTKASRKKEDEELIDRLDIVFTIRAATGPLMNLIEELQRDKHYLILGESSITADNEKVGLRKADLTVSALKIRLPEEAQ